MGGLEISAEAIIEIACPSCGEIFAVAVGLDAGCGGRVSLVEDCQVCCRPASITVHVEDGQAAAVEAFAA